MMGPANQEEQVRLAMEDLQKTPPADKDLKEARRNVDRYADAPEIANGANTNWILLYIALRRSGMKRVNLDTLKAWSSKVNARQSVACKFWGGAARDAK